MNIEVVITLTDAGIQVRGPLDQPVLCYGLLEAAKDVVRTAQQKECRIVPVTGDAVSLSRLRG